MKPILFSLCKNSLPRLYDCEEGEIIFHTFPDGESYIKINTPVLDRKVIFFTNLAQPNEKILPLIFAANTAKKLGAKDIGLIAPYLPYMRQDKAFQPGEGITSQYFAKLISQNFNWLMTVDPHLHRYHSLNEIYSIPTYVWHATEIISKWIKENIKKPLIIGPDQESEQWASEIANMAHAEYVVLNKTRRNDRSVEIALPSLHQYKNHQAVLIDDIISTARTMIETIKKLKHQNMAPPVCIGVHAIFAGNAYQDLQAAGAEKIITCNSIPHFSNALDLSPLLADSLKKIFD